MAQRRKEEWRLFDMFRRACRTGDKKGFESCFIGGGRNVVKCIGDDLFERTLHEGVLI